MLRVIAQQDLTAEDTEVFAEGAEVLDLQHLPANCVEAVIISGAAAALG
jgi:hypothetical protein